MSTEDAAERARIKTRSVAAATGITGLVCFVAAQVLRFNPESKVLIAVVIVLSAATAVLIVATVISLARFRAAERRATSFESKED